MTTGRVAGKVAVVSGGASGIGAVIVRTLASEGADVVIADIDLPGAERVAADQKSTAGTGVVVAREVDVSSEQSVASLVSFVEHRHRRVDILVNSAAITDPAHQARDGNVTDLDFEVWNRTLAVDLSGAMLMCRGLIPLMTDGGSIINITSNAGLAGDTSLTAYAAAKAALHQLTRTIATSFGRRGIRCNAVSPAHIASPSFAANVPADIAAALEANCLVPRLGRPDDVARAVLFFASDASYMITGETLRVDGGALAHLPTYADQRAMTEA